MLPQRIDQSLAEANLPCVKFVDISVLQVRCNLQPELLLHHCDIIELVADQSSPVHVALEIEARVAYIACVKEVFYYNLNI